MAVDSPAVWANTGGHSATPVSTAPYAYQVSSGHQRRTATSAGSSAATASTVNREVQLADTVYASVRSSATRLDATNGGRASRPTTRDDPANAFRPRPATPMPSTTRAASTTAVLDGRLRLASNPC